MILFGCRGRHEASVTGVVTLGGQPLPDANLVFHPVEKGPLAYASSKDDGSFEVKTGSQTGLTPGKYKVTGFQISNTRS